MSNDKQVCAGWLCGSANLIDTGKTGYGKAQIITEEGISFKLSSDPPKLALLKCADCGLESWYYADFDSQAGK